MTAPRMATVGTVRRPVINGDPSQIVGPPWTAGLYYFVLLAAAGVDVVAFHQVLLAAVDERDLLLWILVVGFTVVCLALAHTIGIQAKNAVSTRHVVGARTMAVLCLIGWAALGAAAFAFRWYYDSSDAGLPLSIIVDGQELAPEDTGQPRERHLSALLFLALYVATGLVSGVAGYMRHNPAARQYTRALSRRTKAATHLARLKSKLKAANELAAIVEQARQDRAEAWASLEVRCRDAAIRLKSETRLALLGKSADPGAAGRRALEGPQDQPNQSEEDPQ